MTTPLPHDPLLYRGCAEHYLRGRPPYSTELGEVLQRELRLDGHGTLVDIGCGPGVLAVELAPLFDRVIGIDPDPHMLEEARRHAAARGRTAIEWRRGVAEEIAALDLPRARVVTFGQSFHWTDRDEVAAAVHELLVPGGAMVLVAHDIDTRPRPAGPGDPPIPQDDINAIIVRHLGPDYRQHAGSRWQLADRYADAMARTTFGSSRTVHAPGREDLTRDVDGVISGILSTSFAAPHRFGDLLGAFIADMRGMLEPLTPTARFWDWPGDTAIIIATKPE